MLRYTSDTLAEWQTTVGADPADSTEPAWLLEGALRAEDNRSSGRRYGIAPGMTHTERDAESTAD